MIRWARNHYGGRYFRWHILRSLGNTDKRLRPACGTAELSPPRAGCEEFEGLPDRGTVCRLCAELVVKDE